MSNLLRITRSHMQQQEARWPLRSSHRHVWSQHVCMTLEGAFHFSEYFLYPPPPLPETPPLGRCVSLGRGFFSFYGTAGCPALGPHPSSSGSDRWGPVEDALSSRTHAGTDKEGQRVHLWNQLGFCNFTHAKANKVVIKCINRKPQILRFIQFMRSGSLRGKCVFIWPCVHLKTTQIAFISQQQIFQEKHLGVKHDAIQLPRNKPKSQSSQHARLLRLCSELRHFVFVLCSVEGAHV